MTSSMRRLRKIARWAALAAALALAAPTRSPAMRIQFVGSIGNPSDFGFHGDYAYVSEGYSLKIVDFSHPESPKVVGVVDFNSAQPSDDSPSPISSVSVKWPAVYVRIPRFGGYVLDVSNPKSPQIAGEFGSTDLWQASWIRHDVLVTGTGYHRPKFWEFSDLTDPLRPSTFLISGQGYPSIGPARIGEKVAYAIRPQLEENPGPPSGNAGALRPSPLEVHIHTMGSAGPDPLAGAWLRANDEEDEGTFFLEKGAWRFGKAGGESIPVPGLDPAAKLEWLDKVDEADLLPDRGSARKSGSRELRVGKGGSLILVDLADPNRPRQIGAFDRPRGGSAVAVLGSLAAMLEDAPQEAPATDLCVIDVADPARPALKGRLPLESRPFQVFASAGFAYAASAKGIEAVDLSDPANPRLALTLALPEPPKNIDREGSALWVADGKAGVARIDLSEPGHLALLSMEKTDEEADRVAASQGRVYVEGPEKIEVMESAAGKLASRGAIPRFGESQELAVISGASGRILHIHSIGDNGGTVASYDLSNPLAPREIAHHDSIGSAIFELPWMARWIGPYLLHGFYWSYSEGTGGVLNVVKDPLNGKSAEIGVFDELGRPMDCDMSGDLIYVADARFGLVILRVEQDPSH